MFVDDAISLTAVGIVTGLLILATILSYIFYRLYPTKEAQKTKLRVKTWWIISGCFFSALALGSLGIYVLFGLVSILALKEIVSLDDSIQKKRSVWGFLTCFSVMYYIFLALSSNHLPIWGIITGSISILYLTTLIFSLSGQRGQWLNKLTVIMVVGGLSHVVLFLPNMINGRLYSGKEGYIIFFLVLLTSLNDVAQYLWGKSLGKRKILPTISPGKTWGGLFGGVITTAFLAAVLAPVFSPLNLYLGIIAGIIISLGGFSGDIIFSAYKRKNQAKESGYVLPGHGGILDRIDSLCLSAPLLFYFMQFSLMLN